MTIPSKLPKAGTTIFAVMSQLAREHQAINLSQGFPDFDCSPRLIERTHHYISEGFNQYAPMQGVLPLRERIAEIISGTYGAQYHPDTEITVTAGATQAIYTAITAFVHPGDEVIVFEPAYDCYVPAIQIQGGRAIPVSLRYPGYSIDWDQVRSLLSPKTRMIIINTPHNPSGAVFSEEDMKTLESLIRGKEILVLSDEVYEHMIYDGAQHQSVARFPALAAQSLLVSSFGKTVHTTGWKIGYVAAPQALMAEFRKVHQFLVFAVNHPLQLALADYLADASSYKDLRRFYQAKRDYFLELMKGSRFEPEPCQGTYFQVMRYGAISSEKDTDFAIRLTKEHKVAAIPMSVFYEQGTDHRLLRFCFAKKEETLEKAAAILCRL